MKLLLKSKSTTCDRCGRHITELEAFGEDDPIKGNYIGYVLVKKFRTAQDHFQIPNEAVKEYNIIYDEYTEGISMEELNAKHTPELVHVAVAFCKVQSTMCISYECRECIIT